ncbi:maleylpyruvate isomerase family mycothiol-dependent enzyme [Nocardioides insulae]|uniref:maleylpyruvate isomerase family mycothiol-dependent enzyme n=1 Tax=Nocardioides insulae TaxID=394734 RepID=UPI0003FD7133|nr:maleylpyruvate isomerase family mycothiol-dependent enzyme [Nocardioides insulae]
MSGDQRDTRFPTTPDPATDALGDLRSATIRLVRTVDGIEDGDWTSPSRLPEWSRAHVVAHLALHAEGVAGAVVALLEGEETPMYASVARRNSDIDRLATASPPVLRDRLMGATTELARALAAGSAVPELGDAVIERTPGSARRFRVSTLPLARLREVEIHHADLGLGYEAADWPTEFVTALLDTRSGGYDGAPFRAHATDLGAYWVFGVDGDAAPDSEDWQHPTVRGPASSLAWWSTGRPVGADPTRPGQDGAPLSCEGGEMPRMEGM